MTTFLTRGVDYSKEDQENEKSIKESKDESEHKFLSGGKILINLIEYDQILAGAPSQLLNESEELGDFTSPTN